MIYSKVKLNFTLRAISYTILKLYSSETPSHIYAIKTLERLITIVVKINYETVKRVKVPHTSVTIALTDLTCDQASL